MTFKHFLNSAGVSIAVAVLFLVLGVAGELAWFVWRSPGIHQTSASVPVVSNTTSMSDRSVTISESYTDFRWTPVHWAPSVILALAGLLAGFSWAHRRNAARRLRGQSGEA
jgi:hypothetical protein